MDNISEELKTNRIKNSARNVMTGLLLMITVTIFPFVIRTLMMKYLGDQLLGLNSVLQSTIMLLNMAELGLGSVIVYFIYKPAANGDIEAVNAFLYEIKKLYSLVALIILTIGIVMCFFIPKIVGTEQVVNINVKLAYLLFLIATILPYLLWPESGIILNAYQRKDLQNIVSLIMQICMYVLQIFTICVLKNYCLYIFLILLQGIFLAFIQHLVVKQRFPNLHAAGKINKEESKEVRVKVLSMIGHQLDEKLLNHFDTVFISAFLGLKLVTIYGNYMCFVTALAMVTGVVYDSVLSSIGNAIAVESPHSNKIRFDCIFFASAIISGWSTLCLMSLYQPFMKVWMPNLLLSDKEMIYFCVYSYCSQMRKSVQTFKNASGMWEQDKWKPYVSMAFNIILNIILIHFMGMVGVILASIICITVIELPWEVRVLYKQYFNSEVGFFYIKFIKYTVINALLGAGTFYILNYFLESDGVEEFLINCLVCFIMGFTYLFIYRKSTEFNIWKKTFLEIYKFKK